MRYSGRHPATREAYARNARDLAERERNPLWEVAPFAPHEPGRIGSSVSRRKALAAVAIVSAGAGLWAVALLRRRQWARGLTMAGISAGSGLAGYLLIVWYSD